MSQVFRNAELVSNDLSQFQNDAFNGAIAATESGALLQNAETVAIQAAKEAAFQALLEKLNIPLPFPLPSPPQINVQDMVQSLTERKGKPPRMPNEFFIYRKALVKELKTQGYRIKMTDMSQLASRSWKEETRRTKLEYRKIAREIERSYNRIQSEQLAKKAETTNDTLETESNDVTENIPLTPESNITPFPEYHTNSINTINTVNALLYAYTELNDIIAFQDVSFSTPNSETFPSPCESNVDTSFFSSPDPANMLQDVYPFDLYLQNSPTLSDCESVYLHVPNTPEYSPISNYGSTTTNSSPTTLAMDYEDNFFDFTLVPNK